VGKPRASGTISINLGMANVVGTVTNMYDTDDDRATKMFMVDEAGHRVMQKYLCKDAICGTTVQSAAGDDIFVPTQWSRGDLTDKGRDENGEIIVMTEDEIAEARGSSLPKCELDLDPRSADAIASSCLPSGTTYWFEPTKPNDTYTLLYEAVEAGEKVFVGSMRIRDADKFYRLITFGGGLVIQELIRPTQLRQFDAPAQTKPVAKYAELFDALVEAMTEDFDPLAYESEAIAKTKALIAAKSGTDATITAISSARAAAPDDDIETALLASLKMMQDRKAAKLSA